MNSRTYQSPEAFKRALEDRLRSACQRQQQMSALSRYRQLLIFDRFLARVALEFGDVIILKGGLALEFRLDCARSTNDVDLRFAGSMAEILSKLQAAGQRDLGDFMAFRVEPNEDHPTIRSEGMKYEGLRFKAECRLAGKVYGSAFGVDVAGGDPMIGAPDLITGAETLAFAGISPPRIRIYPAATHIAEKLHALTLPRERPNSRVKDLPDLALLALTDRFVIEVLRDAIDATFRYRGTHPPPPKIPLPDPSWDRPYRGIARADRLPWPTLESLRAAVVAFIDPVLEGRTNCKWSPEDWSWQPEAPET